MAGSQRTLRVADQIQRTLAELLRTEVKDPRLALVTITEVQVTPDLQHAKVYVTTLLDGDKRAEILAGLRSAAGYLRGQLGRRLKIYTTPELHFEYDASIERGVRLTQLIDKAVADHPQPKDGESGTGTS
jgi:ribosome-binding factor A